MPLSEEQTLIRDTARAFARDQLAAESRLPEPARAGAIPRASKMP